MKGKTPLTILTLVVISLMLTTAPVVHGATSGGEGLDRWVNLSVEKSGNYSITSNMTIPETISENYTFEGDLTYEDLDTSVEDSVTSWVNVTVNGTTYSDSVTLSSNNSVDIEVVAENMQITDNTTITVSLETDTGLSDSWSSNVEVISDTSYLFGVWLVDMIIGLIPLIVVVSVLIPVISKIGEISDEI